MNIDAIQNGVVIDHIKAGSGMKLCSLLGLDSTDLSVAIIRNVNRRKMGKKDIIKIDSLTSVNLDLIGYVDPGATVNIIRDGVLVKKLTLDTPDRLVNVIKCKNPRCITSCEQELPHVFRLADRAKREYRCIYCETRAG